MAGRWVRRWVVVVALGVLAGGISLNAAHAQGADDLAALRGQVSRLHDQGKYAEAIPLAERYVALARQKHGEEHTELATAISWLANVYRAQGRYAEAEPLHKRSLAIREKALGPDHPDVGQSLNNLALLYDPQGRYAEAEPLYKRSLAIREKALGADHPDVGQSLNNLAGLYLAQGRYAEAEPLFKRSLAVSEKALGADHPDVGQSLNNLALLYLRQGRYDEAEPLYKRSLAISEKALGPDHPDVGTSLNNLAGLYERQGRYAEAEPLYKRSLAISEKALGPDHPDVSQSLNNLAGLYERQGRYDEAEPLYKRSLAISEKALGPDHPDVGTTLNNLAGLYDSQGRYAEAEPLYKRALAISEKALGPDHPDVGQSLSNLAGLYFVQRDWARAADFWRRSTAVIVRRAQRGTDEVGQALTGKRKGEAEQESHRFWGLVKVAYRLAAQDRGAEARLAREMFDTAQWARGSEAAASLAQMAARAAKGDAALGPLIRERQDLVGEWQRRDQARSAAVSQSPDKRDRAAEGANVARLSDIDVRIAEIDQRLKVEFPDYTALASPAPLSVADVQGELRVDEALVLILDTTEAKPTPEETFIWVVTKTDVRWVKSELGTPALTREVAALRCGLDDALWNDAESYDRCVELLKKHRYDVNVDGQTLKVLPFDHTRAHKLYQALFGAVEDLIAGKHLLLVPSGALTQLPFQVLVTDGVRPVLPKAGTNRRSDTIAQRPVGATGSDPEGRTPDHRAIAWLARKHAITVPAVSSLKALRRVARPSGASKPMIGFGNPLLDGPQDDPRWGGYYKKEAAVARERQGCPVARRQEVASLRGGRGGVAPVATRGGLAELAHLRAQTPLPETADELCAVARDLGADAGEMRLGARATEREIKALSDSGALAQFRIVHFATHGTLAGQIGGTTEPGLILTPPEKASAEDDGYLSASEIAAPKLDADWVILSACNTAGPAGGGQEKSAAGAEALSGLARAFFYAQARALLVSHWEVDSEATVKLITAAVGEITRDKSVGRAEALRRAMLALIDKGAAHEAHPSFWAPFVVVGEGAAAK